MSRTQWTTVRVRPSDRAAVISALFEMGAEGVQEQDDEIITHLREVDEKAHFESTLDRNGWVIIESNADGQWWSATIARPQ